MMAPFLSSITIIARWTPNKVPTLYGYETWALAGKKSPCLNSSRGVVARAVGADHDNDDREEYCLQSGMGGENEVVRGTKAHPTKAHMHMTSPFPSFLARNIKLPSRQQGFLLSLNNIGHLCLSPHDGVFLSISNRAGSSSALQIVHRICKEVYCSQSPTRPFQQHPGHFFCNPFS